MAHPSGKILALAGGVGGAKLALGLARVLPAEALTPAFTYNGKATRAPVGRDRDQWIDQPER